MREPVTPTPSTLREHMIEYSLILRRLSERMHSILREPETIPIPFTLRRSLTDCVKAFDECAVDLEALAATATYTTRRVPTWRDGVKVALGFLVPSVAFVGIVVLLMSSMLPLHADPQQRLREAKELEWMSMSEQRLKKIVPPRTSSR